MQKAMSQVSRAAAGQRGLVSILLWWEGSSTSAGITEVSWAAGEASVHSSSLGLGVPAHLSAVQLGRVAALPTKPRQCPRVTPAGGFPVSFL